MKPKVIDITASDMVIETKFLLGIFLYPALKVNLANMNFEKPLALGGQVNLSELGRCPKMDKKQRKMQETA